MAAALLSCRPLPHPPLSPSPVAQAWRTLAALLVMAQQWERTTGEPPEATESPGPECGPHRPGSTAGSAARRRPGRGRTARRRSSPPGPGTAGMSLRGTAPPGGHTGPSALTKTSSTGLESADTPPCHPQYPGLPADKHSCLPPRSPRARHPPVAPASCDPQHPHAIGRDAQSLTPRPRAGMCTGHITWAYLAGRAGRAPWAAAPSRCPPARSGPSWRWTTGPGSAGSRPAPSCSGTGLPAGASWTLGDTTDPNNPEKLPGEPSLLSTAPP